MRKILVLALGVLVVLSILFWILDHRSYNVILITVDTLRADFLSCYNRQAPPTPHIDGIARQSVLFLRSYTTVPITLPAHASILSSHEPHDLGLFNNGDVYDHRHPLISELLQENGYRTAAFVSLGVLKSNFGLGKGFQEYEDDFSHCNRYYKVASEVNDMVFPWLNKERERPFFAWIHYSDPHGPYIAADAPPDTEAVINDSGRRGFCLAKREKYLLEFMAQPGENTVKFRAIVDPQETPRVRYEKSKRYLDKKMEIKPGSGIELRFGEGFQDVKLPSGPEAYYFEGQAELKVINKDPVPVPVQLKLSGGVRQLTSEILANYALEVQYVDRHIGALWERLGLLGLRNKTILIITADHGEGLSTHRSVGHVDCLYNEVAHVPLIIHYPGLGRRGTTVSVPASHLDLMPTILNLLHISDGLQTLQGQSLMSYVSWSPLTRLRRDGTERQRVHVSTYTPEAPWNSFAAIEGQRKLIYTPARALRQWEAFDLSGDPTERKNMTRWDSAALQGQGFSDLSRNLQEYAREAGQAHSGRKRPRLDEEQERMLQGLGYLDGHEPQEGSE